MYIVYAWLCINKHETSKSVIVSSVDKGNRPNKFGLSDLISFSYYFATMAQVDVDHMCHNFRGHNNVTYLKHMDIICFCFHHISEVSAMHACEILPQFDGLVPEIHNSIANAHALRLSWTNPSNWWQHNWWILLGLHWGNPIYGYCKILERTHDSGLGFIQHKITRGNLENICSNKSRVWQKGHTHDTIKGI